MGPITIEFAPVNTIALSNWHQQFYNAIMQPGEDPSLFIKMETIRFRMEDMESKMDDSQFLLQILASIKHDAYRVQLHNLRKRIGPKVPQGQHATIEEVKTDLKAQYDLDVKSKYSVTKNTRNAQSISQML